MLSFNQTRRWVVLCSLAVTLGVSSSIHAATVLITGANSGIGLELATQYAQKGWTVIATHRRDETPRSLADLSARFKTVRAERMDVQKPGRGACPREEDAGRAHRRDHQQCRHLQPGRLARPHGQAPALRHAGLRPVRPVHGDQRARPRSS